MNRAATPREGTDVRDPRVGALAIVPSNDLPSAIPFWERLGFIRTGGDRNYIIMTGWDCEVHLTPRREPVPGVCRKTTTPFGNGTIFLTPAARLS